SLEVAVEPERAATSVGAAPVQAMTTAHIASSGPPATGVPTAGGSVPTAAAGTPSVAGGAPSLAGPAATATPGEPDQPAQPCEQPDRPGEPHQPDQPSEQPDQPSEPDQPDTDDEAEDDPGALAPRWRPIGEHAGASSQS